MVWFQPAFQTTGMLYLPLFLTNLHIFKLLYIILWLQLAAHFSPTMARPPTAYVSILNVFRTTGLARGFQEQDETKVDSENKHGTGQENYCRIPLCFQIPVIIDDIIVQSYWQIAVSCTELEKSQRTIFVIKLCLQSLKYLYTHCSWSYLNMHAPTCWYANTFCGNLLGGVHIHLRC